jgi:hypothetical protein
MSVNQAQNRRNVFVLTTGLSGSSLVTGLIAQAGFWTGEKTEFKDNSTGRYETYENSRFVELNNRLIELSGRTFDSFSWYDGSLRSTFADLYHEIDLAEFNAFANQCSQHQPWILKDPKLWITLGFWLQVFAEQQACCVIVRRDPRRLWLSQTLKRIIYDYRFLKENEYQALVTLKQFLDERQVERHEMVYENLLAAPGRAIESLNRFLSIRLREADWSEVYQPQTTSSTNIIQWVKAGLIYIKNYSGRMRA